MSWEDNINKQKNNRDSYTLRLIRDVRLCLICGERLPLLARRKLCYKPSCKRKQAIKRQQRNKMIKMLQ